jgi:hypothetical protein
MARVLSMTEVVCEQRTLPDGSFAFRYSEGRAGVLGALHVVTADGARRIDVEVVSFADRELQDQARELLEIAAQYLSRRIEAAVRSTRVAARPLVAAAVPP